MKLRQWYLASALAGLLGPRALVGQVPPSSSPYLIERSIAVPTGGGAEVCTWVARPRQLEGRQPALLTFTIYADSQFAVREAVRSASQGYVGVVGFTRGKACGRGQTVPYLHDGEDAAALIAWIARQPWSDGRVGMYGGSYSGFAPWAAAKLHPPALKAILVGAPVGPGIDVPMEGGIFFNFLYPWPFYAMYSRWLDTATYNEAGRWNRLNREWYLSGRAYRALQQIDGTPNPGFAAWIAHPGLDSYWRSMLPTPEQFAAIDIPVLQTAGYFFGGPGAAIWYFRQHYLHNAHARHYLIFGPWDHPQAQRGVVMPRGDTLRLIAGYETDPVSRVDLVGDVRYPWFDHVFRGAPLPSLIRDRITYQVPGANAWKGAASIATMSEKRLRLYFDPSMSAGRYRLDRARPAGGGSILLTVNLADRSDVDRGMVGGILAREIDTANAIVLMSDPLEAPVEIAGMLYGRFEVITNKRDFDFAVTPYELMEDGTYFQLPPVIARASYAANPARRRLLVPGARQSITFESSIRLMSRRVNAGSRIVLVVSVPRSPNQQINYGSGKDPSDESIADAGAQLQIEWLPGSYVELPVHVVTSDARTTPDMGQAAPLPLRSALQARTILAQAISAVGGLATLERLRVTRHYQGSRTDEAQNVRPLEAGEPQPVNGRPRIVSIRDYGTGDIMDLSVDTIPGDQPLAIRSVIRGDTAWTYMYDAGTLRFTPSAALPIWRAFYRREEIEGLLLAAWNAPGARMLTDAGSDSLVMSFTDNAGVTVALYFDPSTHLPIRSEMLADDPIVGDVTTQILYRDWREVAGIRLPHEIRTLASEREVQRLALTSVEMGRTPADSLFEQPAGTVVNGGPYGATAQIAPDVYVVQTRYQSMVLVFDEYVIVLEPGGSPRDAEIVIDAAKRLAPGKPIRYVLATHAHHDHLAGVRAYVAMGATFLTTRGAAAVITRAAGALHELSPDSLARIPRPVQLDVVTEDSRVIRDAHHDVRLYQLGSTGHVDAMLFAYVPAARTLFVADALDIPAHGHTRRAGTDTQRLADRIAQLGLDVETIVPVHGQRGTMADLRASLAKRLPSRAVRHERGSRSSGLGWEPWSSTPGHGCGRAPWSCGIHRGVRQAAATLTRLMVRRPIAA